MIKNYEPLHHKYRPRTFNELIGQAPITTTLKQALISNRIAPAYIFSGPRGTGKTSSARIFAKSLNCLSSNKATTEPCGTCGLCEGINSGNALDVIEIDAASNTGVENIRELIERSRFAPAKARWKVYVIDECHMLSSAAFNALLKTLEEPPPQVVFILATTDPQRVLPTILSRCMRFDFRRISINDLENHLISIAKKETISINKEAISLIAKHSQGGLRDAESLLDQVSLLPPPIDQSTVINLIGAIPEEELIKLAESLTIKDPNSILNICNSLINKGKEPLTILQGLGTILRDLVVMKIANEDTNLCSISQSNITNLKKLATSIELNQILSFQAKLKGSESHIRNSNQPKLWLEIQLLGMLANENSKENNDKAKNSEKINIGTKSEDFKPILAIEATTEESNLHEFDNNINITSTWQKVIAMLELPSTKMLLSQQAKLIDLNSETAKISISEKWVSMIQSRKNIIENAFQKALGSPRNVILIQQEDKLPNLNKKKFVAEKNTKKPNLKVSQENNKSNLEVKQNIQSSNNLESSSIDQQAKQFADFFNGEIINLE